MTIAWLGFLCTISKPFHRLHPYTQCRCILSPCQFGLIQGSTSAYHVVALCASAHRMSREKWQHRANLPISVSERSTSKMQTNHVVCDQIQHGVPEVEANRPAVIRG